MKCLSCGFEFDEGIFCPECGTKYEEPGMVQEAIVKAEVEKAKVKAKDEMVKAGATKARVEDERIAAEKDVEISQQKIEFTNSKMEQEGIAGDELERRQTEKAEETRKTATASFWLGISSIILLVSSLGAYFAIITSIIGIVLGKKGLKTNQKKKAKAGIIMNSITGGIWVAIVIVAIVLAVIS